VARPIPPDRLKHLVDCATDVFIAEGYQRAQMEDVAHALGVGKGTLYGYVESKAALLDAAVRYADGREAFPSASALPLTTPKSGATAETVRSRLAHEARDLELVAALGRTKPRDVAQELTGILRDLYVRMERNKKSIKLVDRCAQDHPELASVWFDEGRWAQHGAIMQYLDRRISEGLLCSVPNTGVAARLLLETIAFWAVHRHWDPSPQQAPEADVQTTVVDMLVRGLTKE
jgi:AcrR family transcriptional regulator